MKEIDQLQNWIQEAQRIVFFGGAGVSTESGIPDFRSKDGLYHQHYAYPPETILSHSFFQKYPNEFYRFYHEKMDCRNAKPNIIHQYLVKLEQDGKLSAIVTQNIDGLHQKAGSKHVLELHGSIYQNHCEKCHQEYDVDVVFENEIPICSCSGWIRPDVVLYEEPLHDPIVKEAIDQIASCDLLIVAGTSLSVYPAASFIQYFQGKHLVIINQDTTSYDYIADLVIHDKLGNVISKLQ